MTDSQFADDRRLDLSCIDARADPLREAAIIAATLRRLAPRPDDVLPLLVLRRRVAVATAALAAMAAASVLMTRSDAPVAGEIVLLGWTQSGHVPTNGELLAVYHGYQP